jgi:hypothetical protein
MRRSFILTARVCVLPALSAARALRGFFDGAGFYFARLSQLSRARRFDLWCGRSGWERDEVRLFGRGIL